MEYSMDFNYEKYYRKQIHTYYELREWNGLLNYLLLLDNQGILDKHWKWQIGQAYIYTEKSENAVDYLFKLHSYYPDQPDIQLTLWDAIRQSGRSPDKFCWLSKPLSSEVKEEYLTQSLSFIIKTKTQVPIYLLHSHLSYNNNIKFDEFDLLQALKNDHRFRVLNDTPFFKYSKIYIAPQGYKNTA